MTREEQIERVEDRCPCCGRPVRVVGADDGTAYYEPVAQPDEITDQMLNRAWNAGQDDLPAPQRAMRHWDKGALRAALRAAL